MHSSIDNRPSRRTLLAGAAATGFALLSGAAARAAGLREIIVAEPVHQVGYLPLYMAIQQGFFAKRGLDVKTITTSGGAHVSALVSGQVFANIGGPESDAMANANGKADPLITICNCVNRANNYMIARRGLVTKGMSKDQIASIMKGKKFALNRYGGTPDVQGRWYIEQMGLDLQRDVTIINQADSAQAPVMVKQGAADITITTEPQITYGREEGIWDDPFFSFPSLGEYAYSVISVRKSSILKEPDVVQALVDGMLDAIKLANGSRPAVEAAALKEFPTMKPSGLKGALDRTYADQIWTKDGFVSQKGYDLDMQIVAKSGEFSKIVTYNDVVDMQFVKKRMGR